MERYRAQARIDQVRLMAHRALRNLPKAADQKKKKQAHGILDRALDDERRREAVHEL